MRERRIWQTALLGALLLFGVVHVAEAAREANIGGTILDEDGNKLEGVLVTVFSAEETRTDETNKKGRFRLIVMDATQALRVRLEKEGYQTVEEPIEVQVGAALNKTWRLSAATPAVGEINSNSESVVAYNAGATAYNDADYATAQSQFEAALALDPELLPARRVLTLVYFHLQNWAAAADSAAILVKAEPDNDAALKIGFDSTSQLDRRDDAVVFLEGLVALGANPETAARVFNQGVAELSAGQRQEAVTRFEQAIQMDPGLGSAYQGLASIHLEDGEYDQTLNVAARLLEVDPGNAEALGIRYEAYRRMGDEENMKAALDELQASDPDRIVDAYYQQGMLLFNEGNGQAAVEAFERVLSADPQHARGHYQMGRAYLSAGDLENGKLYLEKFIEMAPDDPEVPGAKEMLSYLE